MDIDKTMLDELTRDCKTPQDVEKLYSQMLQHMINRALEGEMQAHLGHERHGRWVCQTNCETRGYTVRLTDPRLNRRLFEPTPVHGHAQLQRHRYLDV